MSPADRMCLVLAAFSLALCTELAQAQCETSEIQRLVSWLE